MANSSDLAFRDGIPVTTPERTLLDLGAVCHESVVEMALDAAEKDGLVTVSGLRRTLQRLGRQGRNGAGVLRRVLDLQYGRPAVPESEMETRLFQVLRRHGLPAPVAQYEIRDGGAFIGRVDAAYPDLRIAIEYDSVEHHTGRRKILADSDRRNRLWAVGWFPITATVDDLKSGGAVVCAAIAKARRMARPPRFWRHLCRIVRHRSRQTCPTCGAGRTAPGLAGASGTSSSR
jgi:hypothetical protein